MRFALGPLLACIVSVAALGVVHGVYSDRWGSSDELQHALNFLPRVPAKISDWDGEDIAYEPEDMIRAGIKGSVHRQYKNRRTAESVSLLLVCGRGGPICVHTPDVCYTGAGYQMVGGLRTRDVETADRSKATFRFSHFVKSQGVVPSQLEVYWSWSREGAVWRTPENPRLALARSPALFKLYVVGELHTRGSSLSSDAGARFLKDAVPAIRQSFLAESP